MSRKSPAFPIVISGPSGVGKTTLVERLVDRDPLVRESISATTRPPRDGEKDGLDYFFVPRDAFERMKKHELLEWAEVYGECYGTPRGFVESELQKGLDVVLNIDTQGGNSVKKAFPGAYLIFILPPSFKALEKRIRSRGTDEDSDVASRLDSARKEAFDAFATYDRLIVNDELAQAVEELVAVIRRERGRREGGA